MKGQLTWLFTSLAIGTMVVIFAFSLLSHEINYGMQTDAELRARELSSIIHVMKSSDSIATTTLFVPRTQCEIIVDDSSVNMTIGEGSKKANAVVSLISSSSTTHVEKFSAQCKGEDLMLTITKSKDSITLTGGN